MSICQSYKLTVTIEREKIFRVRKEIMKMDVSEKEMQEGKREK